MDFSLTDKTALVTGSYRGTGLAIAKTLIAEGAKVLVHGITAEQAAAARTTPWQRSAWKGRLTKKKK